MRKHPATEPTIMAARSTVLRPEGEVGEREGGVGGEREEWGEREVQEERGSMKKGKRGSSVHWQCRGSRSTDSVCEKWTDNKYAHIHPSKNNLTHCSVQKNKEAVYCLLPVDTWGTPVGACVGSKEGAGTMSWVAVGLPSAYPLCSLRDVKNTPLSIDVCSCSKTSWEVSLLIRMMVYVTDTIDSNLRPPLPSVTARLIMDVPL